MSTYLDVLDAGFFSTIQDSGRFGFEHLGIPPSGPMDAIAQRIGNALVGNPAGAPVLEMTLQGGTFRVAGGECSVCVTGAAPVLARFDGRSDQVLDTWAAHRLAPGTLLSVGGVERGMRVYLAVHGGFDVPPVLGSASTLVRAGLGGIGGRRLAPGDRLPVAGGGGEREPKRCPRRIIEALYGAGPIGILAGPQDDRFAPEQFAVLQHGQYVLSAQSDRMGYRLTGPAIAHRDGPDIVSDAIVAGSIQVPGNGQPIIALHDRQTTGGYAKIATVIAADLPRLGQYVPGQIVRFAQLDLEAAVERWRGLECALRALQAEYSGLASDTPSFTDSTQGGIHHD